MQDVVPLMLGFRMQLCDPGTLSLIPPGAFLLAGQFPLFPGKLWFHFPVRLRKIRGLPIAVHVELRQGHIQADGLHWGSLYNSRFRVFHQEGVIRLPVRLKGNGHGFQLPAGADAPVEVQFDRVLMLWEFQGAGRLIQEDVAGGTAFAFPVYSIGGIRFLRPLFGLESRIP